MSVTVKTEWDTPHQTMLIPFAGFYESLWDAVIDDEIESATTDLVDELKQKDARFGEESFGDLLYEVREEVNFRKVRHAIAKEYAERFGNWLVQALELDGDGNNVRFSHLDSPREYNFRTDWVFVDIQPDACERLRAKTDWRVLSRTIIEHHAPRSGFVSRYSAWPDDWKTLNVLRMDHNELFTILCARMASEGHDADEVEGRILEDMDGNGVIHNILYDALDLDAARKRLLSFYPA